MQQLWERSEKMREKPCWYQGQEKVALPCSLWWSPCWNGFSLAAHGGAWGSRGLPCSLSQCQSSWMYPEGGCSLYRVCHSRLLPGAVTRGETTLKQSVPVHCRKDTCWSNSWRTASVGGTPHWNREGGVEEGAAEEKCCEVTTTPFPCSPTLLVGRR